MSTILTIYLYIYVYIKRPIQHYAVFQSIQNIFSSFNFIIFKNCKVYVLCSGKYKWRSIKNWLYTLFKMLGTRKVWDFFRFGNMIYICPNIEITKEWNSSLNTKFFYISCANSLHVNYVISQYAFALILAHHTGSNLEFSTIGIVLELKIFRFLQ